MNVAFLTPSVSRALGGIFEIERELAHSLIADTPAEVEVFGLRDEHTAADLPSWDPIQPRVFDVRGPSAFGYAPGLVDALCAAPADVLHLHALWMYTSVASLRWARRTGKPHVVTINGMLDPWAVENSRWKKRLAGWVYENANLREAACLQVNTDAECEALRDYGIDTPACIIPNGVVLPVDEGVAPPPWANRAGSGSKVLLFLGRLHPKKGLEELIDGWHRAQQASTDDNAWELMLVGWDDGGYEAELRRQVRRLHLSDSVNFLGPRFGDEKEAAFHHADAFILPSHSEGLPMAVLEAWSHRLPTLISPACNLPDGREAGAALSVAPSADSVAETLAHLWQRPASELTHMGEQGRALVERKFTWPRVAQQLYAVYQWVAGHSPRPDCVRG
ncbi:MAG: glycosyl transferase family 1 [Proteobacteria bacterium SW_6_67_9]|nr:MAG: glycosyl transferase family 1 [Proteobacteria bacterium SW_6_67_9]